MASEEDRPTDLVMYGSPDSQNSGVYKNLPTGNKANIIEIASKDNQVFNDGVIRYSSTYIQKAVSSLRQATMTDRDINWSYKPVVLWELAGETNTKSQNEESSNQASHMLGAYPLNSVLSSTAPYVTNNVIYNNTIDIGEAIYWITRYSGHLYANGEIIRYDAVEYSIPGLTAAESANGNVWISSVREYQKYFAKIPFNGKMYPTGLISFALFWYRFILVRQRQR